MTWEKRDYQSPEYVEWRKAVRKRDKGRCQMPGCKKRGRQVHHIQRWADAPLLRFEEDNGITLCRGCHDDIKDAEDNFILMFMEIVRENKK